MKRLTTVAITAVAVAGLTGLAGAQAADKDRDGKLDRIPEFEVDPSWPKELPDNWLIGQVGGIAVDRHDNIWILQRARTLTSDEAGATEAFVDPDTGETATNEEGRKNVTHRAGRTHDKSSVQRLALGANSGGNWRPVFAECFE